MNNSQIVAKVVENDTHGRPKLSLPICTEIIVEQDIFDEDTIKVVDSVYRLFSKNCLKSNTFSRKTYGFATCSECKRSHEHFSRRFKTWADREKTNKVEEQTDINDESIAFPGSIADFKIAEDNEHFAEEQWIVAQVAERSKQIDSSEIDLFENFLAKDADKKKDEEKQEILAICKFSIDMTVHKLRCLRRRTWLNDEVVNFYMCLLQERSNIHVSKSKGNPSYRPLQLRSSHFFNSFFMYKLLDEKGYNYEFVRRWTKKFNVFEKDKIFFPINIHNQHWTLLVLFDQQKKICYYDSMTGDGQRYLDAIMEWVKDTGQYSTKPQVHVEKKEWDLIHVSDLPQQGNGYDCGMFLCMFSDFLSDDVPLNVFSQADMEHFRQKIGTDIIRGNLNYGL